MILTVTMNPSVDISYPIPDFKLDDVNRVEGARKTAGGKGLNVARVIKQMGEGVVTTGVLGGTIGDFIIQELSKDRIENYFLKISQESRNCVAILHDSKQTEILESGPTLTAEDVAAFLRKYESLLTDVSLVTISGSLPKGLPPGFYRELVERSHVRGIPIVVDTSGESLRQVLVNEVKPFAIKPNITELSQLLGINVEPGIESLSQALSNEYFQGVEWIVVSMGCSGAFVKNGQDFYQVTIPKINVVNPVGSGDATVAGFAVAVKHRQSVQAVLKTAMTTGILNAMEDVTGYINTANFESIFNQVKVKKIDL
ncbi:tagatose-6-phosphate kinase [Neobacillus niacini]|uniref:tagatose-6-phosphate kinase n=1 Tax=Neobacillus niacini TaxID=86668 RepID=UPI003983CB3A